MDTTTINVKTRLTKDSEAKQTALTINWDVTTEQLQQLAQSTVVIRYQAIVRAAGTIPATDQLDVSSLFVKRERTASVMTPEKVLAKAKADPEFMNALAELLKANHK